MYLVTAIAHNPEQDYDIVYGFNIMAYKDNFINFYRYISIKATDRKNKKENSNKLTFFFQTAFVSIYGETLASEEDDTLSYCSLTMLWVNGM